MCYMSTFLQIEEKLHQFIKKYYLNELIKGTLLFFSFGLLYLIFTLFVEHFLWLNSFFRTVLFWLFVCVESFLVIRFIAFPIFKLLGIRKGISLADASSIIGSHFLEVNDKLLNILQLQSSHNQSDLLLASIEQKSKELQPIPFLKAIDFKENTKYLKLVFIPIVIVLLVYLTDKVEVFTKSLNRVVNYTKVYQPPAPFNWRLQNTSLKVIQGKSYTVFFAAHGKVLPSEAQIYFKNQVYYLDQLSDGSFSYTFTNVQESIDFYIAANTVFSDNFTLNVIKTPTIQNIFLRISYPNYLKKQPEKLLNTSNIVVPEGTKITWNVEAVHTDSITFSSKDSFHHFIKRNDTTFTFSKRLYSPIKYEISSSNTSLKNFEKLQYSIGVVKDEYPTISVQSNIDSISSGFAQFGGQVSDDYGLTRLELVYYAATNLSDKKVYPLSVNNSTIQNFFYSFPEGLSLTEGTNYEFFFQVFDNDAVNGPKKSISKIFNYRLKTEEELSDELLEEQKNSINNLQNSLNQQQREQQSLQSLKNDIQHKKRLEWNDRKKIDKFLNRQEKYTNMMERQTEKLQQNLEDIKEATSDLKDKKEVLQQRLEEFKKSAKEQKLLEELSKMADKLDKENLLQKAKQLAQQNKQRERSLERMLELTKRFYVEQKAMQIANKLKDLSNKQEKLSLSETPEIEKQKDISKTFTLLKKELSTLSKDNEKLKESMELPNLDSDKEKIDNSLKSAEQSLSTKEAKKAKMSQKKSSEQMNKMASKLENAMMEMQGETIQENMEDLRNILENLVTFSFKQENLMNRFSDLSTTHPDFGSSLKRQHDIRTYFQHIDDSLYVLSMRLPKISTTIQDNLSNTHYNLEAALDNFSENRFSNGISNQRYVMTATNKLADYLSNTLNGMQNAQIKPGKGKGKGQGFSLPDIIKKQQNLNKSMQKGSSKRDKKSLGEEKAGTSKQGKQDNKGNEGNNSRSGSGTKPGTNTNITKEGNSNGSESESDQELYQIYKQQAQLRQALENAIKEGAIDKGSKSGSMAKKALKTMEELENDILERGFSSPSFNKMNLLEYQLLKLETAFKEQGFDSKRQSNSNKNASIRNSVKALNFKKQFFNEIEILNRQSLPLHQIYKVKVRNYFSEQKND